MLLENNMPVKLETGSRTDNVITVMQNNSIQKNIITGYIGMYLSFDEASITNVAVLPAFRQKGYGKALVSSAKTIGKEKQIERIFLEVRVSNASAISLYQKMDFENLGIRKNFYDHPKEDAYIMSCDLTSI